MKAITLLTVLMGGVAHAHFYPDAKAIDYRDLGRSQVVAIGRVKGGRVEEGEGGHRRTILKVEWLSSLKGKLVRDSPCEIDWIDPKDPLFKDKKADRDWQQIIWLWEQAVPPDDVRGTFLFCYSSVRRPCSKMVCL